MTYRSYEMPTNTQELSKATFRANPALWHQSDNLEQILPLLQHLANDGNVTVALLAADFAERSLPYAGANKAAVLRCVTAVRTWASNQTDATLQECKDAANAANAAGAAAYAAGAAAYAAGAAADAAAYAANAASYAANAAAYAANARQAEQQWQLAHVRTKHPLTEL